jgi:hypothetical protein
VLSVEGIKEMPEDVRQEKEPLVKRAMLGHIRVVGELFMQRILSSHIMHKCISILLGDLTVPDEESLECPCKLLVTIEQASCCLSCKATFFSTIPPADSRSLCNGNRVSAETDFHVLHYDACFFFFFFFFFLFGLNTQPSGISSTRRILTVRLIHWRFSSGWTIGFSSSTS